MGQRLVPHSGYRQKQAKLFNYVKTQGKITDILKENSVGIVTSRDNFVFDTEEKRLKQKIYDFLNRDISDQQLKAKYDLKENKSWTINSCRTKLEIEKDKIKHQIYSCLYRPFDIQYLFYNENIIERSRKEVMQHMVTRENVGLITCRQQSQQGVLWSLVGISNKIMESCAISNKTKEINNLFPLYVYPKVVKQKDFDYSFWPAGKDGRRPNLSPEFVEGLAEKIKLDFVSDGAGDLENTFGPEDVFHYIYAVFHSTEYRKRYAEFLKIDFPRVPWPKEKRIFVELCKVGEQLTGLHLMEADILQDDKKWPKFDVKGSDIVESGYPKYVAHADLPEKEKVYINQDQYFEGVRPEVWEFHIGGYQVCEKWLKDRRGRKLDYEDICHYQKITTALGETIKLMVLVDRVIDSNGVWPIK